MALRVQFLDCKTTKNYDWFFRRTLYKLVNNNYRKGIYNNKPKIFKKDFIGKVTEKLVNFKLCIAFNAAPSTSN